MSRRTRPPATHCRVPYDLDNPATRANPGTRSLEPYPRETVWSVGCETRFMRSLAALPGTGSYTDPLRRCGYVVATERARGNPDQRRDWVAAAACARAQLPSPNDSQDA